MPCHIFSKTQKQKLQWMLPLCSGKSSAVLQTHRHGHVAWVAIKGALCSSVTPGFCFLHGLRRQRAFPFSGTHVERWYVWILNRMPQRIPNWEHGVAVVGEFYFYFLLCQKVSLAHINHSLRTVTLFILSQGKPAAVVQHASPPLSHTKFHYI